MSHNVLIWLRLQTNTFTELVALKTSQFLKFILSYRLFHVVDSIGFGLNSNPDARSMDHAS